uniref:Uncharacterized protein n=1 Tax=Ixodes ricinus TaxID=34613 RepID=A0A6B0UFS5_IXORI
MPDRKAHRPFQKFSAVWWLKSKFTFCHTNGGGNKPVVGSVLSGTRIFTSPRQTRLRCSLYSSFSISFGFDGDKDTTGQDKASTHIDALIKFYTAQG